MGKHSPAVASWAIMPYDSAHSYRIHCSFLLKQITALSCNRTNIRTTNHPTNQLTNQPTNQPTNQWLNEWTSIHLSIYQPTSRSVNLSINQSNKRTSMISNIYMIHIQIIDRHQIDVVNQHHQIYNQYKYHKQRVLFKATNSTLRCPALLFLQLLKNCSCLTQRTDARFDTWYLRPEKSKGWEMFLDFFLRKGLVFFCFLGFRLPSTVFSLVFLVFSIGFAALPDFTIVFSLEFLHFTNMFLHFSLFSISFPCPSLVFLYFCGFPLDFLLLPFILLHLERRMDR